MGTSKGSSKVMTENIYSGRLLKRFLTVQNFFKPHRMESATDY